MELELGLALPGNPHTKFSYDLNDDAAGNSRHYKRGFDAAFAKTQLPIFSPEISDGDGKRDCIENQHCSKLVMGWPPVKSARRRLTATEDEADGDVSRWRRSGKFVKVKMEGVGIGRKVDLSLHQSYDSLLKNLTDMFPANQEYHQKHREYTIIYEDGEGDWMLVGDVPWITFIQSVKRLKILC